jgi:hypothetical protein
MKGGNEAKNNSKSKGKGKGKGKGKAKGGNHVGDGSPSEKGGRSRRRHPNQNQNQNRSQQQKQPPKQQHQNQNHHPNGQQSGSASSAQNGRGRGGGGGGHVHAGQKRKATESVTDDITGTDDGGDRGQAPKRQKSEKRPRQPPSWSTPDPEPNADSSGAEARFHPDFWHPDGSVIIQVEKTKFRLHQSMLEKKSAYFAAAFGEKGSHRRGGRAYLEVEIDERSLNGHHLPVYRVSETTADDFATLLTVIEESTKYADEIPPMPVLAGILRAARALSFESQRIWAERIFERMWPATLDTLTTDRIPHAAVALALARTCGLRGVQKRASYELLRMPTFGQAIVAAPAAHVEGEEDSESRADADADADADMGLDDLSRADMLRLLHTREQLVLAWAEIAGKAPTDFVCPRGTQAQITMPESGGGSSTTSSNNDGRRSGCASASADRVHARWAELVHTTGMYVQRMVDPLTGLQDLMEIPWREEGFCKKCVAARINAWDEFRRIIWDDLDVWLQLTAAENA